MLKNLKQFNLPEIEEKVLKFWERDKVFEQSLKLRRDNKEFVFYEGPPTANGRPGTHHVLARVYKDIILRYKTMRGFHVARRAGWDTQGLPVEIGVEKELGLKDKNDIEKYGVAKFNKKAKESVWKYKDEWEKLTKRIGFWLSFDNAYVTYENSYLEKLWWVFKQIDKRKLLKKSYKIIPYCPRCQTALSSHELGQPGAYKLVKDPSVYLRLRITKKVKVAHPSHNATEGKSADEYLLIWTTTPWTLPANVAVACNPKLDYKRFQISDFRFQNRKEVYYLWSYNEPPKVEGVEVEDTGEKIKGKEMVSWKYEAMYSNKGSHQVYLAGFVSAEDGMGLVHVAPAFGEDDLELMRGKIDERDIPMTVDDEGRVIDKLPGAGKFVKDADRDILTDLEKRKILYLEDNIEHEYPFCWRCSSPLIYKARWSWFIEMSKLRKDLDIANQKINWVPDYVKEGRFGNWIKEAKDWAISRDRYWGTPLPIWECTSCNTHLVVGGLEDLKKYAYSGDGQPRNEKGELDLHRPFVDEIYLRCLKCKKKMKRVPEVADVWFDSGAMPFASGEYPDRFPADYISEAMDQTRGWFYTLLAISVLMKQKEPFKNVISLGLLVDKNGQKMSKSKGNAVDPWELVNKYGVDAARWYFYSVNQPGDVKKFNEADVGKVLRRVVMTIYHSYKFLETYTSKLETRNSKLKNILDRWILARYNEVVDKVTKHLEKYQVHEATKEIEEFIDDLSRWYIRRSRKRLAESAESAAVLHYVLLGLSKLMAPFIPFFAEALYVSLHENTKTRKHENKTKSVHLEDFPKADKKLIDKDLLKEMAEVRRLASLGLAARAEAGIKVRQPLSELRITNLEFRKELLGILAEEINVKKVIQDKKLKSNEVKLDTKITPVLRCEGLERELVRMVQGMRQDAKLKPEDKIQLFLGAREPSDIVRKITENNKKFADAIGAKKIYFKKTDKFIVKLETKLDNQEIWIGLRKI
ncbi:MAG: isoleucine--tRNA ligase [Patescibacteria group bacterium]